MDAKTINEFWRHASSLPTRGTTGGFVHRQYIAATREMTRRADTLKRAVVGTVHRREFEVFIYPSSYAEQERLNRNGRRTTVIVDFQDQWIIDETRQPIGSSVRIKQFLRRMTGKLVVKGFMQTGSGKFDFSLPGDRIDRVGLLSAVKREFANRGIPLQFRRGWSNCSIELAKALGQPPLVNEADVVGWCGWGFRLPGFGITIDGFDASAAAPLATDRDPGGRLAIPTSLTLQHLRPISVNTPEVSEFWAVVRCMLLKIMATRRICTSSSNSWGSHRQRCGHGVIGGHSIEKSNDPK